jgi:hypothetical protein
MVSLEGSTRPAGVEPAAVVTERVNQTNEVTWVFRRPAEIRSGSPISGPEAYLERGFILRGFGKLSDLSALPFPGGAGDSDELGHQCFSFARVSGAPGATQTPKMIDGRPLTNLKFPPKVQPRRASGRTKIRSQADRARLAHH